MVKLYVEKSRDVIKKLYTTLETDINVPCVDVSRIFTFIYRKNQDDVFILSDLLT